MIQKYNMDIKGIIHIGGHYGEELEDYVRNGVQEIIIFEPITSSFEILKERSQNINANIQGHQVALGSTPGTFKMYVSNNEKQSSSILKPKVHLEQHAWVLFDDFEDVEVKLLDDFDCEGHNFICMDVQGYELEVLKGGTKTLEGVDYICCEVNRAELYENNAYVEEIDSYLSQYNMTRVETNWAGGTWGDALYVRQ
jgi:FkbM family methyltransferase